MEKNKSFQGMRAIAFLMVFMSHVYGSRFSYSASWAVSFFFIVSGFLYGYGDEENRKLLSPIQFTIKKIKKIYPFYVFAILVSLPYFIILNSEAGMNATDNVKNILVSLFWQLTCLQAWSPTYISVLISANWFLSALFMLYFITPYLIRLARKIKRYKLIYILSIACGVLLLDICLYFAVQGVDADYYIYHFPPFRIPAYFLSIIIGMTVKKYSKAFDKYSGWAFAMLICVAASILLGCFGIKYQSLVWRSIIWTVPNLIICVLCCSRNKAVEIVLGNKFMAFLGDISFELYLIHCIIALTIAKYTPILREPHTWRAQLIVCFITMVCSVAVAVCWKKMGKKTRK